MALGAQTQVWAPLIWNAFPVVWHLRTVTLDLLLRSYPLSCLCGLINQGVIRKACQMLAINAATKGDRKGGKRLICLRIPCGWWALKSHSHTV